MSQPKRVMRFEHKRYLGMLTKADGEYVLYADYAELEAETVKQIEAALPPVEAYIAELEAEVERLKEVIKAQAKGLDEKFGREGGQP